MLVHRPAPFVADCGAGGAAARFVTGGSCGGGCGAGCLARFGDRVAGAIGDGFDTKSCTALAGGSAIGGGRATAFNSFRRKRANGAYLLLGNHRRN